MFSSDPTTYNHIQNRLSLGCLWGPPHHISIFRFFYLVDIFKGLHKIFPCVEYLIYWMYIRASTSYFHIQILLSARCLQGHPQDISKFWYFYMRGVFKEPHIIFWYSDSFISWMSSSASTPYFYIQFLLSAGYLQMHPQYISILRFFNLLRVLTGHHIISHYSDSFSCWVSTKASTTYFNIQNLLSPGYLQ